MADDGQAIRLELFNADPRSCWLLQTELEAEGLIVEADLPLEYKGLSPDFGTAVFWISVTAVGGALVPAATRLGAIGSDAVRECVRRALDRFHSLNAPAGPLIGPDDLIPNRKSADSGPGRIE